MNIESRKSWRLQNRTSRILFALAAVAAILVLAGCPNGTNIDKRDCSGITNSGAQCNQREIEFGCASHTYNATFDGSPNCSLSSCDSCPSF